MFILVYYKSIIKVYISLYYIKLVKKLIDNNIVRCIINLAIT